MKIIPKIAAEITVLAFILGMASFPFPGKAAEDAEAPQLVSLSLDKHTINTTGSGEVITLTARITDNQSGVCIPSLPGMNCNWNTSFSIKSDSSGQMLFFDGQYQRVSGDAMDGIYSTTVTIPKGSASGSWSINNAQLADKLGNFRQLYKTDLETAFGTDAISVNNTATSSDTTPPQLASLSLDKHTINTDNGGQQVTLTVRITDDQGVCISSLPDMNCNWNTSFSIKPDNAGQQLFFGSQFQRVSGDAMDGTYSTTVTIPQGSAAGNWSVYAAQLADQLGNFRYLNKADMESSFGASAISVNNAAANSDTTPPQLVSLSLDKTQINTDLQDQTLTLTMRVRDTQTGACVHTGDNMDCNWNTSLSIMPLIGTQTVYFGSFTRVSGDEHDGVYTSTATIPRSSKEGVWRIWSVQLADKVGNFSYLYADDVGAIAGTDNITVSNTAAADSVKIEKEWNLSSSNASVTFPANTTVTKKDGGSFAFYKMVNQDFSLDSVTNEGMDPETAVAGKLKVGIPGLNLSFDKPVTVKINVGSSYNGKTLDIQTLGEGDSSWANETTCTVSDGQCSFTVNHATYFIALAGNVHVTSDTPTLPYSISKKARKRISYTFTNLPLSKKKYVTMRIGGRKVKIIRVRRSGSNSIVTVELKYGGWRQGSYNLVASYKNKTKIAYKTKKGKTKYRNGWERGSVGSENVLQII